MNLQPIIRLAKKYRWHAIGGVVAFLWAVGYVSLTFIASDEPSEVRTVQSIEAEDMETRSVLNETSEPSASSTNEPTNQNSTSTSATSVACTSRTNNRLAAWLENTRSAEDERYNRQVADIKLEANSIEDSLSGLILSAESWLDEQLEQARQTYEKNVAKIQSLYEQKLHEAGCNI